MKAWKHTDESKRKISEKLSGVPKSEEQKRKMSESARARVARTKQALELAEKIIAQQKIRAN